MRPTDPRKPLDGLRHWATTDPHRIAVSDGTTSLTFAELLEAVGRTAAAGRTALDVAPAGSFLPVLVDRSTRSAAAVLACLLGRVPFVPVDASAPPHLIRRLFVRAGNPDFYLNGSMRDLGISGAVAVDPTSSIDLAERQSPTCDEPALLLFSSGTTGDPKGIVLSWRAVEHRWRSRDAEYDAEGFGPGDDRRQPLIIPMDSSWGVAKLADVASGFTEQVVDVARMRPTDFLSRMAQFAPTAMAVPAQLARVLAQLPPRLVRPLPSVRRLHIAAEGFRYEHLDGLRAIFDPRTTVIHSLASSEGGREIAGGFCLGDAPSHGPLHLGRPLFPRHLRVVAAPHHDVGVGEVHVSGAIASGYLDDPALTAERFYLDDDGRRWWRSRDLVVLDDAAGTYVHAGRMDDVVKVGGKLASPDDVSAVLLGIDGIAAAVTAPVVTGNTTRLVAHVVLAEDATVTLHDVHEELSARLPPHAVPSAVMRHQSLPVTVRGKVDREALMRGPFERW